MAYFVSYYKLNGLRGHTWRPYYVLSLCQLTYLTLHILLP